MQAVNPRGGKPLLFLNAAAGILFVAAVTILLIGSPVLAIVTLWAAAVLMVLALRKMLLGGG